jgi:hypothetical protein
MDSNDLLQRDLAEYSNLLDGISFRGPSQRHAICSNQHFIHLYASPNLEQDQHIQHLDLLVVSGSSFIRLE